LSHATFPASSAPTPVGTESGAPPVHASTSSLPACVVCLRSGYLFCSSRVPSGFCEGHRSSTAAPCSERRVQQLKKKKPPSRTKE
jgi:hypothetical protein